MSVVRQQLGVLRVTAPSSLNRLNVHVELLVLVSLTRASYQTLLIVAITLMMEAIALVIMVGVIW